MGASLEESSSARVLTMDDHSDDMRPLSQRIKRKTVCPPLPMRWLALHRASKGC